MHNSSCPGERSIDTEITQEILTIEQEVACLLDRNADKSYPVRFQYVVSMLEKTKGQDSALAVLLIEKITKELNALKRELDELKRQSLPHNRSVQTKYSPLRELADYITNKSYEHQQCSGELSFDDYLVAQEDAIITSVGRPQYQTDSCGKNSSRQFKALKVFRDSWVKLNSEKIVKQAIDDAPKNAGPLNSHMLAIRSLIAIRELSPEYLNRFVSYIDTLLWLEKTGKEEKFVKRK